MYALGNSFETPWLLAALSLNLAGATSRSGWMGSRRVLRASSLACASSTKGLSCSEHGGVLVSGGR